MTTKKTVKVTVKLPDPSPAVSAKISETLAKLEPFGPLVGTVPNEKIAEMAGVSVAVVAAIAAGMAAETGDAAARETVGIDLAKALEVPVEMLASYMLAHGFVDPEDGELKWTEEQRRELHADLVRNGLSDDEARGRAWPEDGSNPPDEWHPDAKASAAGENDASAASRSDASQPGSSDTSPEDLRDAARRPGTGDPRRGYALDVLPPEPEPPPRCVRLTGSAKLVRDGKGFAVNFRDIFTGDRAAWLWDNHRDLVEVYPVVRS